MLDSSCLKGEILMKDDLFVLKGTFIYSITKQDMEIIDGYLLSVNGVCQGIYKDLTKEMNGIPIYDYTGKIIIPGLVDLHLHAPQYTYRATGMDLELLDWLETYTFPEESKYKDLEYAKQAYSLFVKDLKNSVTTRACIFGTIHKDATLILMDLLEQTGLKTMVGKVNMDRNCLDDLREESDKSIQDTIFFIEQARKRYKNTLPILTPRFIPTCSDELMEKLSRLKEIYQVPLQSHLSENPSEIEWVKQLRPTSKSYAFAYDDVGSFGALGSTVMAHCVYLTQEEEQLMKERNAFIAHCPESNLNLASGIAPVRRFLNQNIKVGLGTDVAGGTSINLLKAMSLSIQASKMYWRLVDSTCPSLTLEEIFYMATKGGGEFFGKVGSFEKGYETDALILHDDNLITMKEMSPKERLERLVYLGDYQNVVEKYVAGRRINRGK